MTTDDVTRTNESNQGTDRPASARSARVIVPEANQWTLAHGSEPNQEIFVKTSPWETNDKVWAKIYVVNTAPSVPPADPDAAGYTLLVEDVATYFEKLVPIPTAVTCNTPLTNPNNTNNIEVHIVYQELGSGPILDLNTIKFIYHCTEHDVSVPAYACPWFAFREDATGPEGEDVAVHHPVEIRIPTNAASVSMTATGKWRHAPKNEGDTASSDANGYGNPQPLVEPLYQTESNKGTNLLPIALPSSNPKVNQMVAVRVLYDVDVATQIEPLLAAAPGDDSLSGLSDSKAFYLGMWDGRQWTKAPTPEGISNSGEVDVAFTWTPDSPT